MREFSTINITVQAQSRYDLMAREAVCERVKVCGRIKRQDKN